MAFYSPVSSWQVFRLRLFLSFVSVDVVNIGILRIKSFLTLRNKTQMYYLFNKKHIILSYYSTNRLNCAFKCCSQTNPQQHLTERLPFKTQLKCKPGIVLCGRKGPVCPSAALCLSLTRSLCMLYNSWPSADALNVNQDAQWLAHGCSVGSHWAVSN